MFQIPRLRIRLSCVKKTTALFLFLRALSSVGRASALQAECRRFDPVSAHHILSYNTCLISLVFIESAL